MVWGKNEDAVIFFVICILLLGTGSVPPLQATPYFADEFEGTSLNEKLWQSEQNRGRRWCGEKQNGYTPGTWVSMAAASCYSTKQPPPYGSIDFNEGKVRLASKNEYIFPYFFTGPPVRLSPFPSSGDFILEIRLKHDYIGGSGSGVYVRFWDDTKPEGGNPPVSSDLRVFSVWADLNSYRIGLLGLTKNYPNIPGLFKVYRLEYKSGKYTAFIDDTLVAGPISSQVRPNAIWVGNPLVLWWMSSGDEGWSAFTIDYIRISQPSGQLSEKGPSS